ncbi:MAG: UDP-glucose/GDP-mannose dehydrogenase family protein [Parachlamydiales bacterium]|nr:UDP-glucose/GDP-mannose dehydrogenase family protein [Parachlamydiales bacterium]
MNIMIIGTGYVGLVSGACFAEMGHKVTCVDIDEKKIKMLNNFKIPIYEPNLEEIVKRNKLANRLSFETDFKKVLSESEVCFICVPTPSMEDGSCNLSYVESVAKEIGKNIDSYKVIVTKSTVPVGTTFRVKEIIKNEIKKRGAKSIDFDVVSNPEFLKEGSAVADALKPDRIVLGVDSEKAKNIMKDIYMAFTIRKDRIITMDILSSEMTKYAANCMLATRISFMNEMAKICKKIGANVNEVRKGIGSDSRIGDSFLYAGIGYGGSCFPKDIKALIHTATQAGVEPKLLNTVDSINIDQKKILSESIFNHFSDLGGIEGKTIAIWGLSFKPDTDDMRDAPSLILIDYLLKKKAILKLYDPVAMPNAKKIFKNHKNLIWCKDETEAAFGSDAIALLTEWKQFRFVDFSFILKNMKSKVFFDGRNQYNPKEMIKKGFFKYFSIGVPDHICVKKNS